MRAPGGLSMGVAAPVPAAVSGGRPNARRSQRAEIRSGARATPLRASSGRLPNAEVVTTLTS